MKLVQNRTNMIADLNVKVAGDLAACTVHLFKNDMTPTPTTVIGDLTEADYTGYAAQPVGAWGGAFVNAEGKAQVTAPSLQFQPSGSTVTNVCYGYYYRSAGGGTPLLGAVRFDEPVAMGSVLDAALVQPTWLLGNAA